MLLPRNMNSGSRRVIDRRGEAVPARDRMKQERGFERQGGWRRQANAYAPIHPNRHDSRRVAASNACARSLSGPRGKPRDEPMIAITSRMLPV